MKRLTILIVLAALVAAAPTASAVRARVWLVAASPVRVSGSGFAAGERVSVTVTVGKAKLQKSLSATAAGRFTAAWKGSFAGGCRSTTIVARGASGRIALWREVANDCRPPIGRL